MEARLLQHPDIPEAHRVAAEAVRAHLVHHRGGAPFLSPADSLLLVTWLEQGVDVEAMLAAIERCAVARRRNRSRTRFTLTSAKRHLHKAPLVAPGLSPDAGLEAVVEELEALDDHARALGRDLVALEDPSVHHAVQLVVRHQQRRWEQLSEDERSSRLQAAIEELGDVANLVDASVLQDLAEEVARHALRQEWPRLDTATLKVLVEAR